MGPVSKVVVFKASRKLRAETDTVARCNMSGDTALCSCIDDMVVLSVFIYGLIFRYISST